MAKEYIEREALIETLKKEDVPFNPDVNYFIMHAPAADVKEVIHAKWEWFDAWEGNDDGFGNWLMLRCSNCLETEGARENAKFCPNCGAIMDGGGN